MSATATYEEVSFGKTVAYSVLLHGLLAAAIVVSAFLQRSGNPWGGPGGGGSTKVTLVGPIGGTIPIPHPDVSTTSSAVDPTKGLYKEEPKPKQPEPPTPAEKIPAFAKNKKLPPSRPSRVFESKTPPPQNAVPYGRGGQPDLPVGPGDTPGSSSGGVMMQGLGGGDFSSRYGWYVEAVRRRISSNWIQSSIDARVIAAGTAHCVVSFTILRDGTVKDARITRSSGDSSYDNSGLRAILSSSPMPGLPGDYSGSYVNVDFDFDLGMRR